MYVYMMRSLYVLGGDAGNVAGPYELLGSILAVLQFVSTVMIFVVRRRNTKIGAAFAAAFSGAGALIVYYLNQVSVGNALDARASFLFGAGFVYGLAIAFWHLRKKAEMRRLHAEAEEAARRMEKRRGPSL